MCKPRPGRRQHQTSLNGKKPGEDSNSSRPLWTVAPSRGSNAVLGSSARIRRSIVGLRVQIFTGFLSFLIFGFSMGFCSLVGLRPPAAAPVHFVGFGTLNGFRFLRWASVLSTVSVSFSGRRCCHRSSIFSVSFCSQYWFRCIRSRAKLRLRASSIRRALLRGKSISNLPHIT